MSNTRSWFLGLASLVVLLAPAACTGVENGGGEGGVEPAAEPTKPTTPGVVQKSKGFDAWWAESGPGLVAACNYVTTREQNIAAGFAPRSKVGVNEVNKKIPEPYYPTEACQQKIVDIFGAQNFALFAGEDYWKEYYAWRNTQDDALAAYTEATFVEAMKATGEKAKRNIVYGLHTLFFHLMVAPKRSAKNNGVAVTFFDDPVVTPFTIGIGWKNADQPVPNAASFQGPVDFDDVFQDPATGLKKADLVLSSSYVNLDVLRRMYDEIDGFVLEYGGSQGEEGYQTGNVIGVYSGGEISSGKFFDGDEFLLSRKLTHARILAHELQHAVVAGDHQNKCGQEECDDSPSAAYTVEAQYMLALDLGATFFRAPGTTKQLSTLTSNVFAEACNYYTARYYTLHDDPNAWSCAKGYYAHYELSKQRLVTSAATLPEEEKATYDAALDF